MSDTVGKISSSLRAGFTSTRQTFDVCYDGKNKLHMELLSNSSASEVHTKANRFIETQSDALTNVMLFSLGTTP